jgi:type II secretory pathway component GspD/PulD (secretin)
MVADVFTLKPQNFKAFFEYGGMSPGLSSSKTVTIPLRCYQPVFPIRKIHAEIPISHSATVTMGKSTREEVKEMNGKIRISGDIPRLGKRARSTSETIQKRSLRIFVMAPTASQFCE